MLVRPGAALQLLELEAKPLAQFQVEIGQGLIEEKQRRIEDKALASATLCICPPDNWAAERPRFPRKADEREDVSRPSP